MTREELLAEYEGLTNDDLFGCLAYAARLEKIHQIGLTQQKLAFRNKDIRLPD